MLLHSQRIICKKISRRLEHEIPSSVLKKSPTLSYPSTAPGSSHDNGLTPKLPSQWVPSAYSLPRSPLLSGNPDSGALGPLQPAPDLR